MTDEPSDESEDETPPPDQTPELEDAIGIGDEDESKIGAYHEPKETPTVELDQIEVEEFFTKKASIDILAQLAEGPKRFSEINTAIATSHGTVATRLTEGAKLDLWKEYFLYPEDGGKIKLYELQPAAEEFAQLAEEEDIRETTERLRQAKKQHDDALENFRMRVASDDTE
ncbi:hypothetical protein ACERIT_06570 [Halopenitus sp. H-Gu1]|uniref:hypothetical protein n=1 Tax=Halopenitus sp. H-Gu1 TaxID=3242697 RepID=UPI00359E5C87